MEHLGSNDHERSQENPLEISNGTGGMASADSKDGPRSAAENGVIFTPATSHPLELEEASGPSSGNDDEDSVMEGYSTQEDMMEEGVLVEETLPHVTTIGMNGVAATDPPGHYGGADVVDNPTSTSRHPPIHPGDDGGQVDLELGISQVESTHDGDDDETNDDGSVNTDTILAEEDLPQQDTQEEEEEQTITFRMRTWQYTRVILHVALFPILVLTSVAIPVLIVMFCFALMFVAMVVLLCVYYCCSPRRGDQAAVPFHVLLRQILEAVEDETNGLREPFVDEPKLSREEIQNCLIRRKLVHFECSDENDQVVPDDDHMDEATREERMHQDMFPVLPDPATVTTPIAEYSPDEESKNDSKPSPSEGKPFRGIRRRWSSRTKRRKSSKKEVEVLDQNNTYELRVSQQCLSFKTDPKVNNSKHYLLTRTFVFSSPLGPEKVDSNQLEDANRSNNSDGNDDEEASNNTSAQRPANSSGRYSLAAAAMQVDDDSSSSSFSPVMALSSSSSSSYSESSSEDEEDAAAVEMASTSDESFLLEDTNDDGTSAVASQFVSGETTGIEASNVPPMDAFPLRLSNSPSTSTATPLTLKVRDDTDANNQLEVDRDPVSGFGGGREDEKDLAPMDPATDVLKADVSQPASNVSQALEPEFDVLRATTPVDVVSEVETDPACYKEQMGKEEDDGGLTPETRQVERWVMMKDVDDLEPDSQPTDDADLRIAIAKASARLQMQHTPKERSPSDLVSLEEAKTEITDDESIVDTVPHPPMDNAYADNEAANGVAANSPAAPTNEDTTSSPQPPMGPNDHRGISSYCNICLLEYEVGDIVVWSRRPHGCHHAWHEDCLIDWLQRKPTCPSCRQEYFEVADAQQPTERTANSDNNSLEEENHNVIPESTHSILVDSAHSNRFLW